MGVQNRRLIWIFAQAHMSEDTFLDVAAQIDPKTVTVEFNYKSPIVCSKSDKRVYMSKRISRIF